MIRIDCEVDKKWSPGEFFWAASLIVALRSHAVLLEVRAHVASERLCVTAHFENGEHVEWPLFGVFAAVNHWLLKAYGAGGIRIGAGGGIDLVVHPASQTNEDGATICFVLPSVTKSMAADLGAFFDSAYRDYQRLNEPKPKRREWMTLFFLLSAMSLCLSSFVPFLWHEAGLGFPWFLFKKLFITSTLLTIFSGVWVLAAKYRARCDST